MRAFKKFFAAVALTCLCLNSMNLTAFAYSLSELPKYEVKETINNGMRVLTIGNGDAYTREEKIAISEDFSKKWSAMRSNNAAGSKNDISGTAEGEKIDDSGLTDEEVYELESKIDEYIKESKKNKEAGYVKPKLSVPKSVLEDEENEIETQVIYDEYEPNDTIKNADKLYLDEYVYGTIEDRDDVDYYKIKFSEMGQAYFRLSVPDTEDYDFYLISPSKTVIDESADGSDGETERIYAFVNPDEYYYIRVEGAGSSDYDDTEEYKIKVRFYNEEEYALSVGADFISYDPGNSNKYLDINDIDTTGVAKYIRNLLKNTDYYNAIYIDEPTYNELNDKNDDGTDRLGSSVVFLDGHGAPTHIKFYFNNNDDEPIVCGVSTNVRNVEHDSEEFEFVRLSRKEIESRLMVFAACRTADEPKSLSNKNLPEYATDNGAECAIGWGENVETGALTEWNEEFFERLVDGYTVYESALYADKKYPGDEVTSWEIYGNEDCIIWRGNGTPISRSVAMPINIDAEAVSNGSYIGIKASKDDLSQISKYIVDNYAVDLDDYKIITKERDNNVLQVYYERYVNGFDAREGFYAIVRDGEVIYFGENENTDNDFSYLEKYTVPVSDEDIEKAKEEAADEILAGYEITEQEISKEVVNGRYSLVVKTEYTIDPGTDNEVYGCKEYVYRIDRLILKS